MSLEQTRQTWERLGAADPLWAVLSTPGTRDGAWNLPWFLETGRIDLGDVLDLMSTVGVDFGRRALDFGCGVGRLTQVLAEHVGAAVGVDLAESMITLAHQLNQVGERVRFVHNDAERLPFDDDSFDSALSLMVLQHLPPRLAVRAILELIRVVRPGGVLALQIPSHPLVPEPLPAASCRARITVREAPSSLVAGTAGVIRMAVTNAGTGDWPVGRSVRLANHWLRDGVVAVGDDGRADLPHTVRPGESVDVDLRIAAPEQPGRYELELDVVQEFVAWWAELGSPTIRVPLDVLADSSTPATHSAPNVDQPDAPTDQPVSPDAEPPADPHPATGQATPPDADDTEPESQVPQRIAGPGESDGGARAVADSAIEMHPLPIGLVRSLCEQLGAPVLASREDTLAGPGWASYTYVIQVG